MVLGLHVINFIDDFNFKEFMKWPHKNHHFKDKICKCDFKQETIM